MMQPVKIQNEYNANIILHFLKNIICFTILSVHFIMHYDEFFIFNCQFCDVLHSLNDANKGSERNMEELTIDFIVSIEYKYN